MRRRIIELAGSGELCVRFTYDKRVVEKIKVLPERRWSGQERAWFVPSTALRALLDVLTDEEFVLSADVEALLSEQDEPKDDTPTILTPLALNRQVAAALRASFPSTLRVLGEVSGFRGRSRGGTRFFELVDRDTEASQAKARVSCVLFADVFTEVEKALGELGASLEDGLCLCVFARVDLYPAQGRYQVVVTGVDVAQTLGHLARKREAIVAQLLSDGYQAQPGRVEIPLVPLRVGLITSDGSDACHDFLTELGASALAFEVTLHHASTQGAKLEPTTLNALRWFERRKKDFDLVVIVRGGGSPAELAWYDNFALGRAVSLMTLPVLVGIGHEKDRTVLDTFAYAQKTPTAAAHFLVQRVRQTETAVRELATRAVLSVQTRLAREGRRIAGCVEGVVRHGHTHLGEERQRLTRVRAALPESVRRLHERQQTEIATHSRRIALTSQGHLLRHKVQLDALRDGLARLGVKTGFRSGTTELEGLKERLVSGVRRQLSHASETLEGHSARVRAGDPARILEKGYALVRGGEGQVISSAAAAIPGQRIVVQWQDGKLVALLTDTPQQMDLLGVNDEHN